VTMDGFKKMRRPSRAVGMSISATKSANRRHCKLGLKWNSPRSLQAKLLAQEQCP
jgi:hypothetical protein